MRYALGSGSDRPYHNSLLILLSVQSKPYTHPVSIMVLWDT